MHVIQVVHSLHPDGGGVTKTVTQLSDSLSASPNLDVEILCQQSPDRRIYKGNSPDVTYSEVQLKKSFSDRCSLGLKYALEHRLKNTNRDTIVHNNGVWLPVNHWSRVAANKYDIPIITQTHGMLEPWAMGHNAIKKRIAYEIYQKKDTKKADVLLATAESERENLRDLGYQGPIAVLPNGIEFPRSNATSQTKIPTEPRVALFLSRIHKKKGLLNLIAAWKNVRPEGWILKIVGPDEGNHKEEVKKAAYDAGLADSVLFFDPIDGAEKEKLFQSSSLFILPTFSENFGVVVPEALSHGVPVITTYGAPWSEIRDHGCGWWIEIGEYPLSNALAEATALTDEELRTMGEKGRQYVTKYDWSVIAAELEELYTWTLRGGNQPEFVSW